MGGRLYICLALVLTGFLALIFGIAIGSVISESKDKVKEYCSEEDNFEEISRHCSPNGVCVIEGAYRHCDSMKNNLEYTKDLAILARCLIFFTLLGLFFRLIFSFIPG